MLIKNQDSICIEDLNVSGMLKNHNLAQAISDVGWYEFVRMLKYKADWNGKNVLQIGRFEPSSKLCSNCGARNENLSLANREWICANCGNCHDRDVNAAINVKAFALRDVRKSGRGTPVELLEMSQKKGICEERIKLA